MVLVTMTVHPRAVHRCNHSDQCGKPHLSRDRKAERRTLKRRERQTWKGCVR